MVLVCIADVIAFSIYMGLWFPDVPPWLWSLGITLIIAGLNLCAVRMFGEMEFWLSLIKVVAICSMIAGGAWIIFFGFNSTAADGSAVRHAATGISNLWSHGGWFPNGLLGFVSAFAVVMFAFGGIEIIGLIRRRGPAAGQEHPARDQQRALAHPDLLRRHDVRPDVDLPMERDHRREQPAGPDLRQHRRLLGGPDPERGGDHRRGVGDQQRPVRRRPDDVWPCPAQACAPRRSASSHAPACR